jgi:tetratricopeptide (TPR) repeat protein
LDLKTAELDKALQVHTQPEELAARLALAQIQLTCMHAGIALEQFMSAYNVAVALADPRSQVTALLGIAQAHFHIKNFPAALEHFEQVLTLISSSGEEWDHEVRIRAHLGKGMAQAELKDHEQSVQEVMKGIDTGCYE